MVREEKEYTKYIICARFQDQREEYYVTATLGETQANDTTIDNITTTGNLALANVFNHLSSAVYAINQINVCGYRTINGLEDRANFYISEVLVKLVREISILSKVSRKEQENVVTNNQ